MDTRLVFDGNHGLITQLLNDDFSAYAGSATKWEGLSSIDITFTQPQTVIAADDDPNWKTINGVPTGTGTITLKGITITQYSQFIACVSGAGQGVRFGEDLPMPFFSAAINENVSDGTELKHIFYKCRATNIPNFKSTTRADGAPVTRDIQIPIAISPLFYKKDNGRRGRAIYDILHSVTDAARFQANASEIVFPTELTQGGA